MFALTETPEKAARLFKTIVAFAHDPKQGTDIMKTIQYLAGIYLETYMVFEAPDESMQAGFYRMAQIMGCEPAEGFEDARSLPLAHIMDQETEIGRAAARSHFEECLDCPFEFHDMMMVVTHNLFAHWETLGMPRAVSLGALIECIKRCMAFEIAAQELCDIIIEEKSISNEWRLVDSIAALSGIAGQALAVSLGGPAGINFQAYNLPETLDSVVYVMTQEAVRLGVPAGSDWRFGLAANDVPVDAPTDLIMEIEPYCQSFFNAIGMTCCHHQAVAAAKAAGRMIAVAAGGEEPEIEPAIAKPLAMAAITESYRFVHMAQSSVSL